jgi:tetratricopeptide (TPR) repeat protein
MRGEFEAAEREYERSIALQPGVQAYAGLAHAALGNRDAARAAFERALALDPNEPTASEGLAALRTAQ